MPVIIHDLEIDLAEDNQKTEDELAPSAQAQSSRPLTPLDLQDIWRREIERSNRVRAH